MLTGAAVCGILRHHNRHKNAQLLPQEGHVRSDFFFKWRVGELHMVSGVGWRQGKRLNPSVFDLR